MGIGRLVTLGVWGLEETGEWGPDIMVPEQRGPDIMVPEQWDRKNNIFVILFHIYISAHNVLSNLI